MESDIWIVLRWWGTLFLVGAVAFPLAKRLFHGWFDEGYFFSKAIGMAVVTYLVYLGGRVGLVPFNEGSTYFALVFVFVGGLVLNVQWLMSNGQSKKPNLVNFRFPHSLITHHTFLIIIEELFFVAALVFWAWVKGHEPSIHGLEKFMDFGFMKSILNSQWFPAPDMWYAGLPINYYYFGHTVVAVLTKLSGIDLVYTFNLMLATLFALTLTMSFSIGYQLLAISHQLIDSRKVKGKKLLAIAGGLLTAFLVTLAGNMQTIYAFTKGYTGDPPAGGVAPFWTILWPLAQFWQKLPEGMERYWYANATRFIPFTIHEFPSYSFVVSDIHGHVLSLPFVLLAIGLLVAMFGVGIHGEKSQTMFQISNFKFQIIFYGLLCGVLLMTNALDGPMYLALFLALLVTIHLKIHTMAGGSNSKWKHSAILGAIVVSVAALASLPFVSHFSSFVHGVAINCPPEFLANRTLGPIIFEGVEKCQHSPLWMMWLLWGFFIYCGGSFIVRIFNLKLTIFNQTKKFSLDTKIPQYKLVLVVFFFFSILLIIFPEFFYFKDIYPAHFRSNTMFKLGYQAFILFSIVSAYSIVYILASKWENHKEKFQAPSAGWRTKFQTITNINYQIGKVLFILFLIPQLFLVSIYPIFSVRSYFNSLKNYEGLDGLAWLKRQYPDDYEAIGWMNKDAIGRQQLAVRQSKSWELKADSGFAIVEADGDSYTDHARISAFTGLPAVIGWPVHEWLWRGSYDAVSPRREDVRIIYESQDIEETRMVIEKYHVHYIIVGSFERTKFSALAEWKFHQLGSIVFQKGSITIYQIR